MKNPLQYGEQEEKSMKHVASLEYKIKNLSKFYLTALQIGNHFNAIGKLQREKNRIDNHFNIDWIQVVSCEGGLLGIWWELFEWNF